MKNGIVTAAISGVFCWLVFSCSNDSGDDIADSASKSGGTAGSGSGGRAGASSSQGGAGEHDGGAGEGGRARGGGEAVGGGGAEAVAGGAAGEAGRGGEADTAGEGGTEAGGTGQGGAAGATQACADFAPKEPVPLQNATATFSQTSFSGNPITAAIDGQVLDNNGWSVYEGIDSEGPDVAGKTHAQIAVFETVSDTASPGAMLTIALEQRHNLAGHQLGKFRISVTADPRSDFADEALVNGDVTAAWEPLHPARATATGGVTLMILPDGSVLASGVIPAATTYTVVAEIPYGAITGFRIEVLEDESLPDAGPGRYSNGNFVLTEFEVQSEDCVRF